MLVPPALVDLTTISSVIRIGVQSRDFSEPQILRFTYDA